ncbi:hypothetical protein Syun_019307 [Stephania yunnanensis]|uniref:Uncharacterized protein n=1 Tax=Stephania yunnanensis TaxID=152371 RepID=A0AAP0NXV3_9MAGN
MSTFAEKTNSAFGEGAIGVHVDMPSLASPRGAPNAIAPSPKAILHLKPVHVDRIFSRVVLEGGVGEELGGERPETVRERVRNSGSQVRSSGSQVRSSGTRRGNADEVPARRKEDEQLSREESVPAAGERGAEQGGPRQGSTEE